MSGKLRGIVCNIEETKTFGDKGFRKRSIALEQEFGSFTNYVPVEFVKDDCDAADNLKLGDEIEVEYQVNGRKWQKDANSEVKYFCSLKVTQFEVLNQAASTIAGNEEDTRF